MLDTKTMWKCMPNVKYINKVLVIRVGMDAIVGRSDHIFLPDGLVAYLQEIGQRTLNYIRDPDNTIVWGQGWFSYETRNIEAQWHQSWDLFIFELRRAHVSLVDVEEELVWVFNKAGSHYTTKLGYQDMMHDGDEDNQWWYLKL
jgi:hypothetical protein